MIQCVARMSFMPLVMQARATRTAMPPNMHWVARMFSRGRLPSIGSHECPCHSCKHWPTSISLQRAEESDNQSPCPFGAMALLSAKKRQWLAVVRQAGGMGWAYPGPIRILHCGAHCDASHERCAHLSAAAALTLSDPVPIRKQPPLTSTCILLTEAKS